MESSTQAAERTGIQAGGGAALGAAMTAEQAPLGKLNVYREMMSDDTIALGMSIVKAPIIAAGFSFEEDDDAPAGAKEFITEQFTPLIDNYKRAAVDGGFKFGSAAFEKVFRAATFEGRPVITLAKLKALLPDITYININRDSGHFEGFKQTKTTGEIAIVPIEASLLYTHDREGDNHYGRPLLENSRRAWHQFRLAQEGACRYDRKVAGTYPVVHFPPGSTPMPDGSKTPNIELAQAMGRAMTSGKSIAVENRFAETVGRDMSDKERRQWIIELLSDGTPKQDSFKSRLEYLDKCKLRGLNVPERAAIEGQHGTKADAETHTDIILATGEQVQKQIFEVLNWHAVNQLLALNYGEEARGTVRIVPSPIVDRDRAVLEEILERVLGAPGGLEFLRGNFDVLAMFERLGIHPLPEGEREDSDDDIPPPNSAGRGNEVSAADAGAIDDQMAAGA